MFIHRSQWDRLLLGSHLYAKHRHITMQTYRKDLKRPDHMIELDLDRLIWKLSCDKMLDTSTIEQICNFVASLPHTLGQDWSRVNQPSTIDDAIMNWYNNIFLDVVSEKMVTGKAFFPTEKTARPLATKTPFLIMSAPNYLENLRRLGFQTFDDFWDESYDYLQGIQRIVAIQKIIDDVGKLEKQDILDMYQKMSPILEHNYKTYHGLTVDKIRSTFL